MGSWSPSKVSDINKLESVQRSFTKRLVGFRHMTYDNRLKLLRVVTLWNRLPASTVLARNLKQFKIAVRITDLSYAILGKL